MHYTVEEGLAVVLSYVLVLTLLIRDLGLPIRRVASFLIDDLGLMLSVGFFIDIMKSRCIRLT